MSPRMALRQVLLAHALLCSCAAPSRVTCMPRGQHAARVLPRLLPERIELVLSPLGTEQLGYLAAW